MAAVVSLSGISMPTMWMGPLLIFIFYVQLAWLPGPAEADADVRREWFWQGEDA